MNKYELLVVLKPMLPDPVRNAVEEKIIQLVSEGGGSILSTDTLGKRYLAYRIKGHTEGYYLVYDLDLTAEAIKNINSSLRIMSQVLRFLVLKK
ncbi:MAG: 30S ribosomal protein S6 [bacterium]